MATYRGVKEGAVKYSATVFGDKGVSTAGIYGHGVPKNGGVAVSTARCCTRKRTIAAARGLVEVHVDALQLQVAVALVGSSGVHAVLVADDFPELRTNLVTALPSLN